MKFVEDAQMPWRNSAVVPWQLPAPASGPQLTLSLDFASECFSVLFCSPLEALSLWQIDGAVGGVPRGRAAICPPSHWHNPEAPPLWDGLPERSQGPGFSSNDC